LALIGAPQCTIDRTRRRCSARTNTEASSPIPVSKGFISLWLYASLFKQAALAWIKDGASSMGAALAFYSAFSLAPLLLIVMAVAGLVYGADTARKAVVRQFAELIGPVGAEAVGGLLKAASAAETGGIATVIGVILLLLGATSVLVELENDLDRIWEAPPREDNGLVSLVRVHVLSFGMILGIGFLLIVSLVAGSAVAALSARWDSSTFGATGLLIADFALSVVIFTVLFGMLYKWLPNVRIAWPDVWIGALTTSVLFNLGRLAIGAYLGRSATASAYAAAGSVLVLLLWLYYSAQIFLFGAEFTWVHAKHRRASQQARTAASAEYQSPG
jgi:membrane protein